LHNDSSGIKSLIGDNFPPKQAINTRFSSGIRLGAHERRPPPFMTDPEEEKSVKKIENRIE
jgi:hypothetical protein